MTERFGDEEPLVSVVIPTYNSEKTIERALASVFAQSYASVEIIIADDCSGDNTQQVVEGLQRDDITFLPSPYEINKGPATSRNRAIEHAKGKYLAFLDSDDEWSPVKLTRQVSYLEEHPECTIVVSDADDVSPEGIVLFTEFESSPPVSGSEAWRALLKRSFIETSSVMTPTSLVRELGCFNPALFVSQDQDLWIRLALKGEVAIIDEVMGKIHIVPSGHMKRNVHRAVDIMLPMIEGHVASASDRLSQAEIDDILGHRFAVVGRMLVQHGQTWTGIGLLARASVRNGQWLGNAFFILHANPIGTWFKSILKRVMGRPAG